MTKRGYSRDFTAKGNSGKNYLLHNIPADLWQKAQLKAKSEGLSMRAAILTLLKAWVEQVQFVQRSINPELVFGAPTATAEPAVSITIEKIAAEVSRLLLREPAFRAELKAAARQANVPRGGGRRRQHHHAEPGKLKYDE